MITHIQGKLVEKNPTYVVIDCGGVGYMLHISLHTYSKILDVEHLKLFTHLQVKEDSHTLYGFSSTAEREVFKLLISVSGVGAGTARTMLSSLSPQQIQESIAGEDIDTIKSVKGIGLKTAQRIVLDLKEKIIKVYGLDESTLAKGNTNKEEALSALEVLGFNKKQTERVVDTIVRNSPDLDVEIIIKEALKNL